MGMDDKQIAQRFVEEMRGVSITVAVPVLKAIICEARDAGRTELEAEIERLREVCETGLGWMRHLMLWYEQPNCGDIDIERLETDVDVVSAALEPPSATEQLELDEANLELSNRMSELAP
jgi:hypothetical protein